MNAETAYLFRHALLRDAAYELQLPGDRARLHALAFYLIEEAFGGCAPHPPRLGALDEDRLVPHATDDIAHELASHARLGDADVTAPSDSLLASRKLYLRRAAEHAEKNFRNAAAIEAWEALASLLAGAARGQAMSRAGWVAAGMGAHQRAERAFEQALAIFRKVGNRRLEGIALGKIAGLYRETSRLDEAKQAHLLALAAHRELGNRRLEGVALGNLAGLYRETGQTEQAEQTHLQALAIHREVGNRRSEGVALGNLALLMRETGRADEAEDTYAEAFAIHREVGNRRSEGVALGSLAGFYRETGRLDQAERACEQALVIHREVGNRRFEGIALGHLVAVYQDTNRFKQAERAYEQVLAIHREVGNKRFEGEALCKYAHCLLVLGREGEARDRWRGGAAMLLAVKDTSELERKRIAMREACARAGVPPFDEEGTVPGEADGLSQ